MKSIETRAFDFRQRDYGMNIEGEQSAAEHGYIVGATEQREIDIISLLDVVAEDIRHIFDKDANIYQLLVDKYSRYKVGEVVAIAQSYQKIFDTEGTLNNKFLQHIPFNNKGWNNKMFVKAELMPHHIRITNIRVERLQDISDEDCLREGVVKAPTGDACYAYGDKDIKGIFSTPRAAFAALIDKVSGKGTWKCNLYVFVYEFELVD